MEEKDLFERKYDKLVWKVKLITDNKIKDCDVALERLFFSKFILNISNQISNDYMRVKFGIVNPDLYNYYTTWVYFNFILFGIILLTLIINGCLNMHAMKK